MSTDPHRHSVVKIETVPFQPGDWTETITKGLCSNCGKMLLSQYNRGFPRRCPDCDVELDNGTDSMEWDTKTRSQR